MTSEESKPEGTVVGATEPVVSEYDPRTSKAVVPKSVEEMRAFLNRQAAARKPLAVVQFDFNDEAVCLTDVDWDRLKYDKD